MNYLLTFLEGIITFISPCLLPMLPVYVAFFAGDAQGAGEERLSHTLICAIGFVVGFSIVFTALGAFAGGIGSALVRYSGVLNLVSGIIVIVLGLNYLGVFNIGALDVSRRATSRVVPRGFFSSLIFGVVFAIGWTPCVGTFLASALSLAANSADTLTGVGLLLSYSLGLGLPFILSAVLINQLEGAFSWIKEHYELVNRVSGVLLVIVGILMATGRMNLLLSALAV